MHCLHIGRAARALLLEGHATQSHQTTGCTSSSAHGSFHLGRTVVECDRHGLVVLGALGLSDDCIKEGGKEEENWFWMNLYSAFYLGRAVVKGNGHGLVVLGAFGLGRHFIVEKEKKRNLNEGSYICMNNYYFWVYWAHSGQVSIVWEDGGLRKNKLNFNSWIEVCHDGYKINGGSS